MFKILVVEDGKWISSYYCIRMVHRHFEEGWVTYAATGRLGAKGEESHHRGWNYDRFDSISEGVRFVDTLGLVTDILRH